MECILNYLYASLKLELITKICGFRAVVRAHKNCVCTHKGVCLRAQDDGANTKHLFVLCTCKECVRTLEAMRAHGWDGVWAQEMCACALKIRMFCLVFPLFVRTHKKGLCVYTFANFPNCGFLPCACAQYNFFEKSPCAMFIPPRSPIQIASNKKHI